MSLRGASSTTGFVGRVPASMMATFMPFSHACSAAPQGQPPRHPPHQKPPILASNGVPMTWRATSAQHSCEERSPN